MNEKAKKKSIFEKASDEVIEESFGNGGSAFGGASGGGSGRFSHTSKNSFKTWSPGSPPFRGMTGSPGGLNTIDIAQESEEFAKEAGKNRLFPLEQIDEHLAEAYINMHNTEVKLKSCIKYNTVLTNNPEKKVLLDHLLKKTEAVKLMIKGIAEDLDRITLS